MDSRHRSWLESLSLLGRAGVASLVVATLLCGVSARVGAATITELAPPGGGGPLGIAAVTAGVLADGIVASDEILGLATAA